MKFEIESESAAARNRKPSMPRERRCFRSLVLGWTDPDSGDRLTARVRGGEELLPELERLGFEVLAREDREEDAPPAEAGVSVVTQLTERSRGHASRRN